VNLASLRRYAARQNLRIRFPLPQGLECLIDEHGVARIPGLRSSPGLNLESELERTERFMLEPAEAGRQSTPKVLSRPEMSALTDKPGGSATPAEAPE
jgi:hypothetical protein